MPAIHMGTDELRGVLEVCNLCNLVYLCNLYNLCIATGGAGNLAQKLTTRCKAYESLCDKERQERRGLLFEQLLSYAVVRGGGGGAHLHLTNQLERMGGGPQPSWQKGRRRVELGACLPAGSMPFQISTNVRTSSPPPC